MRRPEQCPDEIEAQHPLQLEKFSHLKIITRKNFLTVELLSICLPKLLNREVI